VFKIETNKDAAPNAIDAVCCCPANMVVEPTLIKPVIADPIATGKSIYVF